jgi:hypothetical protein
MECSIDCALEQRENAFNRVGRDVPARPFFIAMVYRVQDFERWLEASPRSPAEMIMKNRLRELLAKG